MEIVTVIIFFGKSVKNIWNLNFFNYNHWYRISKTVKTDLFMEQYHSRNSRPDITAKHLEQYHSQSMEQQNRYNSYHSYNVQQQSRYNSYNLERYHSQAAKTGQQDNS